MNSMANERIFVVFVALALLCCAGSIAADEPRAAPETKTVWSNNKNFYAVMDADRNLTEVYRADSGSKGSKLWSMVGWFSVAALPDDGEHLIVGHPGNNLLDLDYQPDECILRFIRRGELIASVSLDEIVDEPAKLPRTVSHAEWGTYLGFDDAGHFLIETYDKKRLAFDPKTGKRVAHY